MSAGRRTLLVTTIGGQVGLGLIYALAGLRDRIRIVGVNSVADVAHVYRCDAAYLAPPTAALPAWSARLREILRAERPDLVLAGRDEDLAPLAALKAEPEFAGTCFLTSGPAAVAIITDKHRSWQFAAARGLPFAETAATREEAAALIARHGFPLIVKPRHGTGGRRVRALTRPEEVEAWLARGGMVFQPFVGPPDDLGGDAVDPALGIPLTFVAPWRRYINATVTVDPHGQARFRGAALLEVRGPASTRNVRLHDPALADAAMSFATALAGLDFVGTLTAQGRIDRDGRFRVFELNGRMSGGVYAGLFLGIDELADALDLLLGGRPPLPPSATVPGTLSELTLNWYPIAPADRDRLERDGVWRHPD